MAVSIRCFKIAKVLTVIWLFSAWNSCSPDSGQEDNILLLMQQAQSDDAALRWRALAALQWQNDPRIVDLMLASVQDPDPRIRKTAARALGWFGEKKAVPTLVAALKDGDTKVANAAAEALGRIKDPSAIPALIATRKTDAVTRAIRRMGSPSVLPLSKLLNEKDYRLRGWAANTLAYMDAPGATRMSTKHPFPHLRHVT